MTKKELLARIEALEARVAALEARPYFKFDPLGTRTDTVTVKFPPPDEWTPQTYTTWPNPATTDGKWPHAF